MKHFKIALFLAFMSLIAGAFVVPFQLESLKNTLPAAEYNKIIDSIPFPLPLMITLAALQIGLLCFVLGWIGLKLTERTKLKLPFLQSWFLEKNKPIIDMPALKISLIGGAIASLLMVLTDLFIFQPYMPELENGEGPVWWKATLAGVWYGGIVEEILLRLFLMTFIVWLLSFLFKKSGETIPSSFYWVGIILSALLFSAGHLPATEALYGELNNLIITRAFVLNGVLAVFFGYLYWKKGLEYAMIAHMMLHVVTQLAVLPFIKFIS
ncbi:CPBP family intramembrane glutamic endopeptidase [Fictibacillus phosphorivorans]|uniref:CPBP family intramembrane glutamic endopeptidase n=1 Tax=Fictibacillus phosphorivorans TaxID=1221500 RepID=UPI00203FF0D5|nr:CPBP family intramembrane glutamic endopeptidase [Fictibacillus phosphorivorans]MCM3719512.1 CPBP family intramembrane metalloprotease [Fictibacillus phosphorivorans]MCM3777203.1 CPBP family intramembrane metalloprotease [Fictibacillus phosphorivorans]